MISKNVIGGAKVSRKLKYAGLTQAAASRVAPGILVRRQR